ncbi:MAG TPA: bifunctional aspartate kinase/homoserine dehydrogenase I [Bacteroidales bacterium]|nr:bifunctional aspartate kinase/homoserine dehydrogenase I [Bacteroidales bacterium]HPR72547.1 bifunctional aspartate kinase/homoserine dehydrogenase I [Bacteroidales bacterium]
MKVLKFGGTSIGSPDMVLKVKGIIESRKLPCVIVVSAFGGVTDKLCMISELASSGNNEYKTLLEEINDKHRQFAIKLIGDKTVQEKVLEAVESISDELRETCKGIYLLREVTKHSSDQVLASGERISSLIVSSLFPEAEYIDSREIIITDSRNQCPLIDFNKTEKLIKKRISGEKQLIIVPGFIGSNNKGETTTLGRGGSDYTAAILAAALNAEVLEIWTDVDGFMTADPKKVERAYTIESLTYSEAMELSHFGAKVVYTPTLRPVFKANIPVAIHNTFNPEAPGTIISHKSSDNSRSPIKGISSIDHIDLITLQGPAMVGVTGTSSRLFGALAKNEINIILITQASSEYSITFAVKPEDSNAAFEAISDEFEREIRQNSELKIAVEKNMSIIAIVGEKMKNTPGISATLFKSLGRNGVNVVATAQGSSELNISVVIKNKNLKKALNVIHDGFFLSAYNEMNIFIAGTGLVGSSLIKQLQQQHKILFSDHNLKVNLKGITNSSRMLISSGELSFDSCKESLKDEGVKADISTFVQNIKKMNLRNSVFIDCTADARVASQYSELLSGYVSVVTANKIACSSAYDYYLSLKNIAGVKGVRFMYETTVGAGLPIIKTISDLILSGDKIHKIEAVLSGTLNFIFNELSSELPLSKAIRKAREKGYSEPDPRIDLSGTDVVRKILILSREAGYKIEQKDVEVITFLPDECFKGDLNEFYKNVASYDDDFEKQRKDLVKQNKKWRFTATLENGKAKVGLIAVDHDHPSYNLEGSNNIVLLTTERYKELPMVIKGYGAGADVTAAGVFADLMRVMNV